MRLIRATISILLICGLISRSTAQEKPFHFEQFPSNVILSHNSITAVMQDHQGFLWLGTWSGLMKYDGYEVKQYKQEPGNINGLESNKITTLFEDSRQRLWVGTRNSGLYLYDRGADRFIQFKHQPDDMNSLSDNNVWSIFEDHFGQFWIGTEKGLNLFQPDERHFIHFTHHPSDSRSISHDFVYSICETPDGVLWIGTENGLNRMVRTADGQVDYFVPYTLLPEGKSVSDYPYALPNYIFKVQAVKGVKSGLWIGTKAGLKRMDYSSENLRDYTVQSLQLHGSNPNTLNNSFVLDLVEDQNNSLWIATLNGLHLLDKDSGRLQRFISDGNHPNILSNNSVRALSIDRSDNLWIGTEGGLHQLDLSAKPFTTIRPDISENVSNQVITSIKNAVGSAGIWVGTRGGGLNYFPIRDGKIREELVRHFYLQLPNAPETADFISDLHIDDAGNLWISTLGSGVVKTKEAEVLAGGSAITQLQQYAAADGLDNLHDEHLMTISGSTSGDTWLGAWDKGLLRYDPENDRFFNYKTSADFSVNFEAFPNVQIFEQRINGRDILWVGTRGGGLLKLAFDRSNNLLTLLDNYRYQIDQPGSISNNFINCIFLDRDGDLWIGTENGLNKWNPINNTFSYTLEKDGLPSGIIQSIQEDNAGQIWISTQSGISRITKRPETNNYYIKNFDPFIDLQSNFFYAAASSITPAGEILFGGAYGLTSFPPEQIRLDSVAPKVALTEFRLFNREIPVGELADGRTILEQSIGQTQHLELSHKDNVISFAFVGLQFSNPQKLKYAYKLEGFDNDWIYTDADQRIAHYTNLPYDDFTFRVKAANSDGFWSEPISLELTIHPPFWLTGWAYLLYFLLFSGILYGALKITRMRANLQHSLQLERLEREKLEEVNQIKLSFFTNISHELRTPLTLIISPLEQWIKERKADRKLHNSYVRMYYNANRLLTMINQLLDIRKSESGLMKLKVAEGDLVKFVKEVTLSFKGLARQRKIDLQFSSEVADLFVWYDRDHLEKVLFNLLSNAFKFTPEDGFIKVRLMEAAAEQAGQCARIVVQVTDSGRGIPQDQIPFVFDRFYQVEQNKDKTRQGGTGIGLALAKTIIEQHHGDIWVESREQEGSSFFFSLPMGNAHFSEDERIPGFQDSENISHYLAADKIADELKEDTLGPLPSAAPAMVTTKADRPTLLIVEDNPDIRAYLRENLEADYDIKEAENGKEGLEKALEAPPDLILADIAMPVMDGIEMCGRIKSDIHTSHVPVILLTARTSLIFKVDGLETGADDYITKPFNMRLLSIRIRNLIQSRRKLKDTFANNFDLSPSGVVMNELDDKFLNQIKKVIENNIDDSTFSVEQLASALFMNRMQLYRKLKALTGKSPNKIIRSFRLQRAAQLLETKQYNVSDVTYMVGYNDLKSFREQFKKEFGRSPSEYV
ncbi:hybrid sensor histidine kinase/response regulator transcription factor [Flavilitoribacter nigricans]|uniref:histidine kinase n=1 Tax=Flavilitoribacter nigricans (strain ATCC 23147 / DSM 23189 / NBRC 102662 / NCIMB 1420 / SS-2) TaxID=1122177 RepID=A0A2D0MY77_FLAN2|nr:two-component regulator propeller domain-containing protein [Flavilitoribacter nigricans]PHN01167.1 hypothetical protein CRP01_38480 [Flavilitoribacter nigricans DSM 23189 = NBRC 102662]